MLTNILIFSTAKSSSWCHWLAWLEKNRKENKLHQCLPIFKNKTEVKAWNKIRQKDIKWLASWLINNRKTNIVWTLSSCVRGLIKIRSKGRLLEQRRPSVPSKGRRAGAGGLCGPRHLCPGFTLVIGQPAGHDKGLLCWQRSAFPW